MASRDEQAREAAESLTPPRHGTVEKNPAPAARTYEAIAVRYGRLQARKSDFYLHWDAYGEPDAPQAIDYFFYVLRNDFATVLFDTGFAVESGERRERTILQAPREAVEQLAINPDEVTHVIVSHCHWDHIGNLDAYPQAEILVPDRELDFWMSATARHAQFSSHVDPPHVERLAALEREGRVTRFDGHAELLPGLTTIGVGGHSPGQQILLVETAGRSLILASDAVHLYDELEFDRPFRVVVDLVEMYDAYELIRSLQRERSATVVPGHDPAVTQRFPQAAGPVGVSYRLG